MFKKLLALALTAIMVMGMGTIAYASNEVPSTDIEIPVVYFDDAADYAVYLEQLKEMEPYGSARGATVISASVIRSGTSEDCELYLNWTGDESYSSFRYKEITVKSTSVLFAKTFGTFGNGTSYTTKNVVSSPIGSTKIGDVTIDSDVEKVKVNSSGLQGYNMKSLSWLSAVEFTGTVTIN